MKMSFVGDVEYMLETGECNGRFVTYKYFFYKGHALFLM